MQLGKTGAVLLAATLGMLSILRAGDPFVPAADSSAGHDRFILHPASTASWRMRVSPWVVNPFDENSFLSPFSLDSLVAPRRVLADGMKGRKRWVIISSDWSLATFYESVWDRLLQVPFSAPLSWYVNQRVLRNRIARLRRGGIEQTQTADSRVRPGTLELLGVDTGAGRVSVNIRGNVNVRGGMVFQDQELVRSTLRESQTSHFEFDQRQNLHTEGKIGERVTVLMDYDSERDFNWENNIRIHFTGQEDEIVQKIEAGNISLSLPSTQFVTFSGLNKGLFGLKSLMKLGPVNVTSVVSIEQTNKEKLEYKGGAETRGYTLPDYQYQKDQYFFLGRVFRDGGVITDDQGSPIVGSDGQPLFMHSFYPLTEAGKHFRGDVVIKEIEVFRTVSGEMGAETGTYPGIAHVDPGRPEVDSDQEERGLYERLERLDDYVVSEDFGFIRLTVPVQQNQVLAVAYTLTEWEKEEVVRKVGQFSYEVDTGDTLHLKLIRPSTPNPGHPVWPLAFKNVYFLGATGIRPEGFDLKIIWKNGDLSDNERDAQGNTFLHLFGLDDYNEVGELSPDNYVDTTNVNIISLKTGELIFPMLHPFEADRLAGTPEYFGEGNDREELSSILSDSAAMYRSLTQTDIERGSEFEIKVSYENRSSTVNLGGFMLVEGSEEVYLNNVLLKKDEDYIIDYFTGTLTFLTDEFSKPGADLKIMYEKQQFVSFDKKTMLGTRAQMDLGPKSFVGGTFLYYNQSVINEKIEVGYEPMRNFIWDLNGRYETDLDFLTRAIDRLPLLKTQKPSSFRIEGEFAQVLPNPNPVNNRRTGDPHGVAYIDDFEGAKRTTNFSVKRRSWFRGSPPVGLTQKNRGDLFWYNPYTQVPTQSIWPNLETSRLSQNELTDILILNFSRRAGQQAVDPDSVWASITTPLYSGDYNQSDTKFFEIWLNTSVDRGKMTVDLGFISEDQNENRRFDSEDVPEAGFLLGNDLLERAEDIGLDGCKDAFEDGYGGCLPDTITYEQALEDPFWSSRVYAGVDLDRTDPNGDNYSFKWRGSEQLTDYSRVNGTEGNGYPRGDSDPEPRYPDTEDINRDNRVDMADDYWTASFDLSESSEDWQQYQGGQTEFGWRQYRIPLSHFQKIKEENSSVSWETIKFLRISLRGIPDEGQVRIAKVELVGNEWLELGVRSHPSESYKKAQSDSAFAVTVINTHDNPDYAASVEEIGVQGEYDRFYEIRHKEQSLVLKFSDLKPFQEGAAQKTIDLRQRDALSFLAYKKMKLFVYGNSEYSRRDASDIEFFMRFGHADNFYELRQPVYDGWDKRNFIDLDLDFLVGLKDSTFVPPPGDVFKVTDSTLTYLQTETDGVDTVRKILIKGQPALNRIQYFEVGVRNTNPTEPIGGEIWLDELRFSHVRKDVGTAVRVQTSLGLADVGNATLTFNRQDADFHVVQKRLGKGSTRENLRVDGRMQVNKFLPGSWGLALPLSVSYSDNLVTPKYLPGTDIPLTQKTAPDSVLTKSRQISVSTSFSKTTKSDRWITRHTLDQIRTNVSMTQNWNSNAEIRNRYQRNVSGNTSYTLNFGRDNYWEPFRFLTKIPWLGKKIGGTHIYYTPTSLDMALNFSESLTEIDPRVGESTFTPSAGLSRNFKLDYKVFENLRTVYRKVMKSDMRKFRNRYVAAVQDLNPGIVTDVSDNLSTTFTPNLFSWFRPSVNYSSNYRWTHQTNSPQEGADIQS
ncbi:MAG: cell surface protein SprA, partial [Fidelibacterota bacterium]